MRDGRAAPPARPVDGGAGDDASQTLPLPCGLHHHQTEPGEAAEGDCSPERHEPPLVLDREPPLGLECEVAPQPGLARLATERRRGEPGSGDHVIEGETPEIHPWRP